MIHVLEAGEFLLMLSWKSYVSIIQSGQPMLMVRLVIGSVVRMRITRKFLRYSSLLPASATAVMPMPAVEAATAAIGRPDRTTTITATTFTTAHTTSASTAAAPVWATTATVRTGSLSVASSNNKSWRSEDLIFKYNYSGGEPGGSSPE